MTFIGWHKNKFKIAFITVLKYQEEKNRYLLLNLIPIKIKHNLCDIKFNYLKKETSFNTKYLDNKIKRWVAKEFSSNTFTYVKSKQNIAILATEVYDHGGHTECIKNILSALPESYVKNLFLTKIENSYKFAPVKLSIIKKYCNIFGLNGPKNKKTLIKLFNLIIECNPSLIISSLHMDDVFGATLLAKIKTYTNIKIIFFNHGSHWPTLGMSFADLIWEGLPVTSFITQKYRGFYNTHCIGIPYSKIQDLPNFTKNEIETKKREIGIPKNCFCTMSGGAGYKFFDNNEKSYYFEMIYRLLNKHNNLYHIVISNFSEQEQTIIDKIFEFSNLKNRLIIIPPSANYKLLFKCADVFIDSFPVSSALTQIDLISLKVPTIVKINKENAIWSFHEYLPKNYKYMFESIEEMEKGIEILLSNEKERLTIIQDNYNYFLDTFEGSKIAQKISRLMDIDDYTSIYDQQISDETYYNLKLPIK